jgi:predicted aspartyl protease
VRIFNPATRRYVDSVGVLDTGSTVTVIPESLVRHLRLRQTGYNPLRGVTGSRTQTPLYLARLEVAGVLFDIIEVAGMNFPHILLGRDILNQFDITLRGKAEVCELTASEVA